jgi:AcrR family transcriptional regulator
VPRRTSEATARLRADLIEHARTLVRRDGATALTMRALAAEAGCAVGLPYKVFADRGELVTEVAVSELGDLARRMAAWAAETGTRSVGENLDRYASILLDAETPALTLAESIDGERLRARFDDSAEALSFFDSLGSVVADYLAGEQRTGRVRADVDTAAFGFVISGGIHNLVASGPGYPRPSRGELAHHLRAIAEQLAPERDR